MTMLVVRGLRSGYGKIEVLHDVDVAIEEGQIVTLIGANGAGKTTLLKTISGLIRPTGGSIEFNGENIARRPPHKIVALGLSQVPEGRAILKRMSVLENLRMGAFVRTDSEVGHDIENIFERFPVLGERRSQIAATLSGGEQQMLAIGRALMGNPRVLLMDEPSEGLAPQIVAEVMATIRKLKESGLSIVLVEQNPQLVFDVADDIVILNTGRVAVVSTPTELRKDGVDLRQHLGVF